MTFHQFNPPWLQWQDKTKQIFYFKEKNQCPLNVSLLIIYEVPLYHHDSYPCFEISDGLDTKIT